MGMTIEEAIRISDRDSVMDSKAEVEARHVIIDTMRKYQKIEEIVGNYGFDTSWLCLKKIREVMEDGKID